MTTYTWPLFVYPSRCCNYRCSYCFTDSSSERPASTYIVENWDRLLDQAAALAVPEVRISGGEPLVLPQIERMCRAILARNMRYTITTNGALIERNGIWLSEAPPETLWISFHREYHSLQSFLAIVRTALRIVPRVGVNVFGPDWNDALAESGAHRIKLLAQNAVGRAKSSSQCDPSIPNVRDGVELRFAAPFRNRGASTCVLRDRPLLAVDTDGRVYSCCATLGDQAAEVGDLKCESLFAVVEKGRPQRDALPCAALMPAIDKGAEGCPVRLYANP